MHERYNAGDYTLQWTASADMAADLFTKSFGSPPAWDAACWLVNIVDVSKVEERCRSGDKPPPTSQGGGKRGEWEVNADGSGTWTRHDKSALRLRTLYRSGPARHEVHTRTTYDAESGDELDVTRNFATAKVIDAELPPPTPRSLRTVFHFAKTEVPIPPDATVHSSGEPAPSAGASVTCDQPSSFLSTTAPFIAPARPSRRLGRGARRARKRCASDPEV